jgi:hypothetical protein
VVEQSTSNAVIVYQQLELAIFLSDSSKDSWARVGEWQGPWLVSSSMIEKGR